MDTYMQAQTTMLADYIRQALSVEDGHLSMGYGGATLHFARGAYVSGFEWGVSKTWGATPRAGLRVGGSVRPALRP